MNLGLKYRKNLHRDIDNPNKHTLHIVPLYRILKFVTFLFSPVCFAYAIMVLIYDTKHHLMFSDARFTAYEYQSICWCLC